MDDSGAGMRDRRGILFPGRLPTFHREAAPDALSDRLRWFWIPRWNLAPGCTSRQEILPFPASNLVVGPEGVTLSGPRTRASHRDLSGRGWAVGALLRPAALASLCADPARLLDTEALFPAPDLMDAVAVAMAGTDHDAGRVEAVAAFTLWAQEHLAAPDEAGLLANRMEDLIAGDRSLVRVGQVGDRLGLSTRAIQRLAQRYVGLTPLAIIRRYRLQEAAHRLLADPSVTIAQVASELGYADHAHLTSDFRTVLGLTPRAYRRDPDHLR